MAMIIKSFSGSRVVDVEIDPFDMWSKEEKFYPVQLIALVRDWAREVGIDADLDELVEFWYEFGDELDRWQEAIATEEEAYFASYHDVCTGD